jgi:hypothetical protein
MICVFVSCRNMSARLYSLLLCLALCVETAYAANGDCASDVVCCQPQCSHEFANQKECVSQCCHSFLTSKDDCQGCLTQNKCQSQSYGYNCGPAGCVAAKTGTGLYPVLEQCELKCKSWNCTHADLGCQQIPGKTGFVSQETCAQTCPTSYDCSSTTIGCVQVAGSQGKFKTMAECESAADCSCGDTVGADCAAWQLLYPALGGTDKAHAIAPCTNCPGVTCTANGHITSINATTWPQPTHSSTGMGSIPAQLSNMKSLTQLDVRCRGVTGLVPALPFAQVCYTVFQ